MIPMKQKNETEMRELPAWIKRLKDMNIEEEGSGEEEKDESYSIDNSC